MSRRALRNRRIRGRMYGGVGGGVSDGASYLMGETLSPLQCSLGSVGRAGEEQY
jgi:hypothetical protein